MIDPCEGNMRVNVAVEQIVRDLSDRGGLGNEWDQIDESIQQEIKDEWKLIIARSLYG
jgi:hypothetical protein